ncbi:hypothetical protein NW198_08615 [Thermophilibacter sp. ET337]|uniref:hypothetical protein n=1 Tax=Thermophilibacter sp. ET337 TaxID=2973084 RepID=UPI0021ACD341|nr:hypothetical protein [Thermophilibacter sp. ET337]MCR8908673.1 hypothetical protein [Thermophilibacter sp. ET337]
MYEKPPVTMNSPKMRENLRARGYSKRTAAVIAVLIAVFLVVNVVQFAVRFGSSVSEQLDAPTEDRVALPYYELTADERAAVDATGERLSALKEKPSSSDLAAELAGWLEGRLRRGLRHTPEDLGIDAEAWAGQMVSRLTYSIEDVGLSGDAAVVGVHVWAPRAGEIVSKASEGMSTYFYNQGVRDGEPLSEDLQEDVLRTFETATEAAPVEERTLDVVLTRSDDGFVVDERALEKDLLNAFGAVA